MHPDAAVAAHVGDPGEVVHGPGVRGAGARHHREHALALGLVQGVQRLGEGRPREPPAVVARQAQHVDVHHPGRGHDRGVRALGQRHLPSARGPVTQSVVGGLPSGHQRRQVARRAPGDEHPARFGRIARQVGDPSQGLVLGPDRAGAVDPARGDRRAGPHHEVEQDRGLRGGARDEGHRRRVVGRDRGGREHLAPDAQRFVAAQAVGGDGGAGAPGQVLAGRGAIERLRARDPVPRVRHDRAREGFGVLAVLVHPIHRFRSMGRRAAHPGQRTGPAPRGSRS